MTQRQLDPPRPIPACPEGHRARHMFDCRRLEARGGHFIECACTRTGKHASFDVAWAHWHKQLGLHAKVEDDRPVPNNVLQLPLFIAARG